MVFSSSSTTFPGYHHHHHLDPPHPNWPDDEPNHQHIGDVSITENDPQFPPPPPLPTGGGVTSGGAGTIIRVGTTADRARLAKLPRPEGALKCPRCDSTNTKFCYFNNYSLSQPRHFCKTCRRYWTRGGALRNVPVGGGCRRNKRTKGGGGGGSKSPSTAEIQISAIPSNSCPAHDILGLNFGSTLFPSFHQLSDFGSGNIGLNFSGFQAAPATSGGGADFEFQNSNGTNYNNQWRLPLFLNTGLEQPSGIFQLLQGEEGLEQSNCVEETSCPPHHQIGSKPLISGAATSTTQLIIPPVKLEDNEQGSNLPRNFLGILGNDHFWGGGNNAWTDLTGFTISSPTSHLL